jgi:hypothetical protein
MRYYLQHLDVREGGEGQVDGERGRERRASRLSVRSDPTADATIGKTGDGGAFWSGNEDESDRGDEDDDDDDDENVGVLIPGMGQENDDDEDSGSESESEGSDAEMVDDEDGADDDDMELFGHR